MLPNIRLANFSFVGWIRCEFVLFFHIVNFDTLKFVAETVYSTAALRMILCNLIYCYCVAVFSFAIFFSSFDKFHFVSRWLMYLVVFTGLLFLKFKLMTGNVSVLSSGIQLMLIVLYPRFFYRVFLFFFFLPHWSFS